jgi:phage gp45-like
MNDFREASTLTRGKLVSLDDSAGTQLMTVEGFRGERFEKVRRAQPHGFSSNPPVGAVGDFIRLGSSDRLVALGFETEGRPKSVPTGAAVLYDSSGNLIFAKAGEGVRVKVVAGGVMVEADTGTITLKRGALTVTMSDTRIDLGGPGGTRVATEAGFSNKVFAIL